MMSCRRISAIGIRNLRIIQKQSDLSAMYYNSAISKKPHGNTKKKDVT
jgi:hypothetical protein